jgi:hypothetical protein
VRGLQTVRQSEAYKRRLITGDLRRRVESGRTAIVLRAIFELIMVVARPSIVTSPVAAAEGIWQPYSFHADPNAKSDRRGSFMAEGGDIVSCVIIRPVLSHVRWLRPPVLSACSIGAQIDRRRRLWGVLTGNPKVRLSRLCTPEKKPL